MSKIKILGMLQETYILFQAAVCALIIFRLQPFALADPGGGAPGARPPLTAADLCFFMPQNANFSQNFLRSLRLRFILCIMLIEIWPKTCKNNDFYFNHQHFQFPPTENLMSYNNFLSFAWTDIGRLQSHIICTLNHQRIQGGAHPARAPPNGRGPMIFLCPKRTILSFFPRLLCSRLI